MPKNIATDQDIVISNNLTDIQSVDSIAKLNVMTEAMANFDNNVPQIMLSQTTVGSKKIWNGDRLTINYASGNNAGYFGISEITGSYRNRLNLELLGANNIFHTSVGGTYGNSFIYSESNKLSKQTHNCNFLHSNFNIFNSSAADSFNFIHSNYNTIKSGEVNDVYASAKNISLYNSNYNTLHPIPNTWEYTHPDGSKEIKGKKGCFIQNQTLIGSNYNYIKGRNINEDTVGNVPTTTFINANSGYYDYHQNHGSFTVIGNNYGYFTNVNGGNIIGIGEGLIQDGGKSDKILLGFYNQNTTNDNEILVVGDGRLNHEYVKGLVSATKNWYNDLPTWQKVMSSISGTGSTAYNSNYYRHNIFTVNKEGYITISDYKVPNNSARYGYKGITAFVNGNTYEIPFSDVYYKINGNDAIDIMQETIDSYTKTIQDRIDSLPIIKFESFSGLNSVDNNTQISAYLNYDSKPGPDTSHQFLISEIKNYNDNTVFIISYQPKQGNTLKAKIGWQYYPPVEAGVQAQIVHESTEISPYCSKQFIIRKPNYPNAGQRPFSGIALVENG